jgi:hypothetical protein
MIACLELFQLFFVLDFQFLPGILEAMNVSTVFESEISRAFTGDDALTRKELDSGTKAFGLSGMAGEHVGEFERVFKAEALDAGAPGFKAATAFNSMPAGFGVKEQCCLLVRVEGLEGGGLGAGLLELLLLEVELTGGVELGVGIGLIGVGTRDEADGTG